MINEGFLSVPSLGFKRSLSDINVQYQQYPAMSVFFPPNPLAFKNRNKTFLSFRNTSQVAIGNNMSRK